jgi:hypothetical protein
MKIVKITMKGRLFKILVLISLLVVLVLTFALKQLNKTHTDIRSSRPTMVLTAQNLISEFEEDEEAATIKFTEKLIQFDGTIFNISISDGNSIITIKKNGSESGIICQMLMEDNLNSIKLKKGENVTIKGICSGFLLDVIMVRCIIVK